MKTKFFPLFAFLLGPFCVSAQRPTAAAGKRTDDYIRVMMAKKHIPAVSVAVLKEGKILKMQSYGMANLETHTPASSQTLYQLGSISKQFLATAVMTLQQGGRINLDSPINAYLDSLPSAWQKITVRNLLSHTSGLVRDDPDFDPLKVRPLSEEIKAIYSLRLDFDPGAQWDYSNMNYYVLAAIIEKIVGTNWAAWISQNVFEPAGMSHTRTNSWTDLIPNRADGYEWTHDSWQNASIRLALRPSGAFVSTIADLAKWDNELYTDKLLTTSSKNQMWTAMKLNNGDATHYGFGWFIDSINNHLRIHHDGGVPGFRSDFERYMNDGLSVIVLTNSGGANAERMAQNVAGFFMPALMPQPAKAISDTEPTMTARVKSFIGRLQQHANIDSSTLSPELAKNYNIDGARRMADAISGKIFSVILISRREKNDRRTYRYRLDYGYDYVVLVIQFNSQNKITGYGIAD